MSLYAFNSSAKGLKCQDRKYLLTNVCRYDRTKFFKWLRKAKQAVVPVHPLNAGGDEVEVYPTDTQPQQSVWVSGQCYASATLPLGKESLVFIQ